MKIEKLKITVFLKEDINVVDMYKYLSNYINGVMKNNEKLSLIHTSKDRYKFYSFCGLMPTPKDKKVYKKDNLYYFYLATPDGNNLKEFQKGFKDYNDEVFTNCSVVINNFEHNTIKALITLTPCTITYNNRSLTEQRISLIRERIIVNLIRKYNAFYNGTISEDFDFIEELTMNNKLPIKIKYKKTSILGFKVRLSIKQDKLSQKLAIFALGTGLLEKNSLGLGYCLVDKGE